MLQNRYHGENDKQTKPVLLFEKVGIEMIGIKKILNIVLCLAITAIIAVWAKDLTWGDSNAVDIQIYMEGEELYGTEGISSVSDDLIPVQLVVSDDKEGISSVYYKVISGENTIENYTEVCQLGEAETLSADACDPTDAAEGSIRDWETVWNDNGNAVTMSQWITVDPNSDISVELAFTDMKGKYYSYQRRYEITQVIETEETGEGTEEETLPGEASDSEIIEEEIQTEDGDPEKSEEEECLPEEAEILPEDTEGSEEETEVMEDTESEPSEESETDLLEEDFETKGIEESETEPEEAPEAGTETGEESVPETETESTEEAETEPEATAEAETEPEAEAEYVAEPEPEPMTETAYEPYQDEYHEDYYDTGYEQYDSSYYYELGYYDGYTDYEKYNVYSDHNYGGYDEWSYQTSDTWDDQADDIPESCQETGNEAGNTGTDNFGRETGEEETGADEKAPVEDETRADEVLTEKREEEKRDNKDGSVYELTELEDINGKYLKESQDLVIYEKNADRLKQDSILVTVAKDGETFELERGKDYTFKLTGMTDEVNTYTYRISRDIFSDDGVYRVFLSSEDEAGNKNYNEAKDASIKFSIDRTDPLIISYDPPADSTDRELKIKDNISLDSVGIYIGDEPVEYEKDGDIYSFAIPEGCEETDVKIVASDSAGNTYERVLNDYITTKTAGDVKRSSMMPAVIASAGIAAATFIIFRMKKKTGRNTGSAR